MFRKVKKKKATQSRRSALSDEEENDGGEGPGLQKQPKAVEPTQDNHKQPRDVLPETKPDDGLTLKLQQQRQSKKKPSSRFGSTDASRLGTRTTITAGQGGNASRKRRRGRIGYGGSEPEHNNSNNNDAEASLYDRDVLAQLKAEQEEWNKETQQTHEERTPNDGASKKEAQVEDESTKKKPAEDFIPLDGGGQQDGGGETGHPRTTTILAGDEALEATMGPAESDSEKRQKINSILEADATAEDSMAAEATGLWQDQIAKRVGIDSLKDTSNSSATSSSRPSLSLDELRQQFADAQTSLKQQVEDTLNALDRRQVDVQHVQDEELQQQILTVKSCGTMLEFYQGWRARAVPHVAALRELAGKVREVQRAAIKLMSEHNALIQTRRQSHVDDTIASLKLDAVLGRQPDPNSIVTETEETVQVDEFGRHVPSRKALEREKREQERAKLDKQREQRKEESGNAILGKEQTQWLMDAEIEETRHQVSSYKEALQFAVDQVNADFRSISQLSKLFLEWYKAYPQEYNDCFASLSLADLSGVLIQVDLCSQLLTNGSFVPKTQSLSEIDFEWLKDIQQARSSKLFEKDALFRLVEKSFIPLLSDVFRDGGYSALSGHQTKDLVGLAKLAISIAGSDVRSTTAWKTLIGQPLLEHLKGSLDDLSLPILSPENTQTEAALKLVLDQLQSVDKLLQHIFAWRDCVESEQFNQAIAVVVLNFLQDTFLAVLSSLNRLKSGTSSDNDMNNDSTEHISRQGARIFMNIWKLVQPTSWLQRPDLLVQATTLRAAAEVYSNM